MATRTEYAVRYTERHEDGDRTYTRTDIAEPPTSREAAEAHRDWVRSRQTEIGDLPVDAEIVTRTVTTTEWGSAR